MSLVPADVGGVAIDYVSVLKALNLNPNDPKVQALVLTCQTYGLDPVLKHMILINGDAYVTHKGMLHVAHTSGRLDGIELVDHGETGDEWWAKVAVYRNDMSRPFTYVGRYPKSGGNRKYGPEMAITRAETMALRRAFDIAAPVQEEQDWPTSLQVDERRSDTNLSATVEAGPGDGNNTPAPPSPLADENIRQQIAARRDQLPAEAVEWLRPRWIRQINMKAEHLTADKVADALALLDECDAEQKATWDKRRRRVRAALTKAGFKEETDVDATVLTATTALGDPTDSTARLSEAQEAAILDHLKPLLAAPGPEAA